MFACRQIKAILVWGYLRDALNLLLWREKKSEKGGYSL
jgi:hypothetical protein